MMSFFGWFYVVGILISYVAYKEQLEDDRDAVSITTKIQPYCMGAFSILAILDIIITIINR